MEYVTQLKENTLNKLAVAIVCPGLPGLSLVAIFLAYVLWYSPFYPVIAIYLFWMLYVDRHARIYGRRRRWEWLTSTWFFKRYPRYFPQTMIKTAELPADDNYLLCMFLHGVFPTAAVSHFGPSTGQFYKLFPGLNVSFHSLDSMLKTPLLSEMVLGMGYASCSQEALLYHLNKPKGHAALLMPGGAAEILISEPGHHRVILKDRKGFIRVGLLAGINLVPIYAFGESDLFYQKVLREGDFLYNAQQYSRKKWQNPLFLANGVGFFQNYFGFLPRKLPVHTVVGAPIKLPKLESVEQEDINYWHDRFVKELVKLFETHKHKFVSNPDNTFLEME